MVWVFLYARVCYYVVIRGAAAGAGADPFVVAVCSTYSMPRRVARIGAMLIGHVCSVVAHHRESETALCYGVSIFVAVTCLFMLWFVAGRIYGRAGQTLRLRPWGSVRGLVISKMSRGDGLRPLVACGIVSRRTVS